MSIFSRVGKAFGVFTGVAATTSAVTFVAHQKTQKLNGTDEFSEFTKQQIAKHPFSGMHEPFITKDNKSIDFFRKNFTDLSHLVPNSVEELQKDLSEKTPVQLRPLSECPVSTKEVKNSNTFLAVGGPPALVTAAKKAKDGATDIIYLCNDKWPISNGSAFHIEEDSDAEAPTGFTPFQFMLDQTTRALYKRESFEQIEKTGMYPWRTLDWVSFMKHPEEWRSAIKVALLFQMKKGKGPEFRKAELDKVAEQCKINEKILLELDKEVNGQLLFSAEGGLLIARDENEARDLEAQKNYLAKEGRHLSDLSNEDLIKKYGFVPKGMKYKNKEHDRVFSPQFRPVLSSYIEKKGGAIINGTIEKIYTDGKNKGGMAKIVDASGTVQYIPFKTSLLSLGNQQIYGLNGKPVVNSINAIGSSGLAVVYAPKHYKFPRVSVFGATNHVPLLSKNPIPVTYNGKEMNAHVYRFTAGAAVAPVNRGKESANHDGTISVGLYNTFKQTLGDECHVQLLTMLGCNRSVGKEGQTRIEEISPGIYTQSEAGGGGITRSADPVSLVKE
jgi:hypothetical protein